METTEEKPYAAHRTVVHLRESSRQRKVERRSGKRVNNLLYFILSSLTVQKVL